MKALILVLAIACAAFGATINKRDVIAGTQFDPIAFKASCPGQCFQQQKYRDWIDGVRPKAMAWYAQVKESQQANIPDIPEDKWNTLCTEVDNLKTCVQACQGPEDTDRKAKVTEVLDAFKDFVCDTTFRGQANCLKQFASIPSPVCNTQCQSHLDEVKTHGTEIGQTVQQNPSAPPDFEKAKRAGAATCKLITCRLTCRKAEITEKCGDAGLEASKTAVRKMANLLQTFHRQFRPAENYPDECKPDKIIEGV